MSVTKADKIKALTHVGLALFGERWKSALADALGAHPNTVGGWASGDRYPRQAYATKMRELLIKRQDDIREAISLLDGAYQGELEDEASKLESAVAETLAKLEAVRKRMGEYNGQ